MLMDFFKKNKKYNLNYFCTALVSHCNLNCKYCDHFSPLSEERFFSVNELEKHFKRINKIMNVNSIGLMGGEPLLHPDITKILTMTRKIFSSRSIFTLQGKQLRYNYDTKLFIFTNGILLDKMLEDFWLVCKKNDIVILISKLPLNINLNSIYKKAKQYNVQISLYGAKQNQEKYFHKIALDLSGSQNPDDMHKKCWHNKSCICFEDGKFFQCPVAAYIYNFNKYFSKNLNLTSADYLDIYKVKSHEEIKQYFESTLPFCRYCNIDKMGYDLPFAISEKNIKEWIEIE